MLRLAQIDNSLGSKSGAVRDCLYSTVQMRHASAQQRRHPDGMRTRKSAAARRSAAFDSDCFDQHSTVLAFRVTSARTSTTKDCSEHAIVAEWPYILTQQRRALLDLHTGLLKLSLHR